MMDLLELLLTLVLELATDFCELETAWRFFLPVFGAVGIIMLIRWTVSNGTAQFVLSAPVTLAGLVGGLAWQGRRR